MTIGPDFVYICIPRTASHAMEFHWLPKYGGISFGERMYHSTDIPGEHRHKFTFTIVRNPYERMMSLWRLCKQSGSWPFRVPPTDQTDFVRRISTFAEWVGPQASSDERKWLCACQMLNGIRLDHFIRYEELEAGLRDLPFVHQWHDLPRVNASSQFYCQMTPEFIRAVNDYHVDDRCCFERFGYKRLNP